LGATGEPSRWLRAAIVVPIAVVALAAVVRFQGLDRVKGTYWDETTYAVDGYAYIGRSPAALRPIHPTPEIDENTWMHPPLGKWMIGIGELPLGRSDWGFRLPPALFGTAGVLLLYLIALELWGSVTLAGLSALLLALDGLHIVQSRLAMLDVFMVTFVLAGVLFALRARRARSGGDESRVVTKYDLLAGAAFGAAIATKWSALPYLIIAAVMAWRAWARRPKPAELNRRMDGLLLAYLAVPAAVYLVCYASFFIQNGPDLVGFIRLQRDMFTYGIHFDNLSPARSSPWGWPFLQGSIDYTHLRFLQGGVRIVNGKIRVVRVLAFGNPVLWVAFLACVPIMLWRMHRKAAMGFALVLVGYLAGWAPWLLAGRAKFVYYILPAVPFMCLAVAGTVGLLRDRIRTTAAAGVAAASGLIALAYIPLWTAVPLSLSTFLRLSHLPGVH
jgi:dolichyl-phosphate-mannose-protein mannosyltransferase